MFKGWWLLYARIGQFLFLGLVGVSIFLSQKNFSQQCVRAFKIFLCGMLVTLATYFVAPDEYVKFGVLHFIAVAIPIVYFFKKRPKAAILFAIFSFFLGRYFSSLNVESPYLFWLGLVRNDFASLDFFPIFPWISAPLIGMLLAGWIYKKREPTKLSFLAKIPVLMLLGRHSLAIYLLHQPILLGLILIAIK